MAGGATRVTVTVKDSKATSKVFKQLKMSITGGIHEEEGSYIHDQGPLTVYEVAAVNEFGGGLIPARMWLRRWVTRKSKKIVTEIKHAMINMIRLQDYEPEQFEFIAENLMNSLKDQILDGEIKPKNAPMTLAKKFPEDRPLFETGQFVDSIHAQLKASNESGSIAWDYEAQ